MRNTTGEQGNVTMDLPARLCVWAVSPPLSEERQLVICSFNTPFSGTSCLSENSVVSEGKYDVNPPKRGHETKS